MRNNLNDTESRSVDMQNLLNKHPHWFVLKGNFVITIVLLLILLTVGSLVKYPEFVNSRIVISPHGNKDILVIGKLSVSKDNIKKIRNGQKIIVKLNNFPSEEFGTLEGQIKDVSVNPHNRLIEVVFPKGLVTSYNKKLPFDKDLTGNGEIVIKDKRLIEKVFDKLNY
jgi:hypothetical protein